MSKKLTYVVRGLVSPLQEQTIDDCKGLIEDQPSFREFTKDTKLDAINTMLCEYDSTSCMLNEQLVTTGTTICKAEIFSIDMKIYTDFQNLSEIKSYRSDFTELIKRWAEKSRLKGFRGWRLNAIRTPVYEVFPSYNQRVKISTNILLGSAIIYNNENFFIFMEPTTESFTKELNSLKKKIETNIGAVNIIAKNSNISKSIFI